MLFRPLAALLVAATFATSAQATVKSGVERYVVGDYKGAMVAWLPFAARGDADALFNLGQLYKLGRGVPKNLGAAADYYRKAAAKGHVPAQSNLGVLLYQAGNKAEAIRWWNTAAAKGDGRAQYMLSVLHFNGDGVEKNWPLAYAYALRAQAANVPQATNALATMNANIPIGDRQRGETLAQTLARGGGVTPTILADARATPKRLVNPGAKGDKPALERSNLDTLAAAVEAAQLPKAVAPTPAPPAPKPAVASIALVEKTGLWRVQLGAFNQKGVANEAWATIKASQGPIIGAATPVFAEAGEIVRLQIGPYPTREEARAVCTRLTAVGRACFVVAG